MFVEVPVLVVLQRRAAQGEVPAEAIPRLRRGIAEAQRFYWRHSRGRLFPACDFLVVDEPQPIEADFHSMVHAVARALERHGIAPQEYSAYFDVSPAGSGTWAWGVLSPEVVREGPAVALHGRGFAHSDYPVPTAVRYPRRDVHVDYGLTWVFVHEFQHVLDAMCRRCGHALGDGDRPWHAGWPAGQHYDYQARLLARFDAYTALAPQYGHVVHDIPPGFAPPANLAQAGLYSDGPPDNPTSQELPAGAPAIPSPDQRGWTLLAPDVEFSQDPAFHAATLAAWQPETLHLRTDLNAPAEVTFLVDCSGTGWWCGRDNLAITVDAATGLARARSYDSRPHILAQHNDAPWWDDEPGYAEPPLFADARPDLAVLRAEGWWSVQLAVPLTKVGLPPVAVGGRVGLAVEYERIGGSTAWATSFELYRLAELTLVT
jgi:hypothetical protein